jgi:hypothetical protein
MPSRQRVGWDEAGRGQIFCLETEKNRLATEFGLVHPDDFCYPVPVRRDTFETARRSS